MSLRIIRNKGAILIFKCFTNDAIRPKVHIRVASTNFQFRAALSAVDFPLTCAGNHFCLSGVTAEA